MHIINIFIRNTINIFIIINKHIIYTIENKQLYLFICFIMFIMSILRIQVPFCLENQTHSSFLQVKNQWSVPILCPANIKKNQH